MRFTKRALVASIVAAVFSIALYFGFAFTTAQSAAAQDHGCTGQCGCVWDPGGTHQHCVYYPDASTCTYDSDCCGEIEVQ